MPLAQALPPQLSALFETSNDVTLEEVEKYRNVFHQASFSFEAVFQEGCRWRRSP